MVVLNAWEERGAVAGDVPADAEVMEGDHDGDTVLLTLWRAVCGVLVRGSTGSEFVTCWEVKHD